MDFCIIENCSGVKLSRKLCSKHYSSFKKLGKLNSFNKEVGQITGCKIENCSKSHLARGYCTKHYQRIQAHNSPISKKEIQHRCAYKNCNQVIPGTRTYCYNCYQNLQQQKYQYQPKKRYSLSKKNAKKKEKEFTLTLEEYTKLIETPCYYCENVYINCGIGLDRIDNSRGYTLDNVLPCCKFCNRMRNEILTPEETKELILTLKKVRKTNNVWEFNFTK